jgi:hypothetical protein
MLAAVAAMISCRDQSKAVITAATHSRTGTITTPYRLTFLASLLTWWSDPAAG